MKAIVLRLTDVGMTGGNQRGIDKTTKQAM